MMSLSIVCPNDNLLQKWYDECYAKYRPIYKDDKQFQWALETCQINNIRNWIKINNPGETILPLPKGESCQAYYKKEIENGVTENGLTKEEKEKKEKVLTKRLWIFAGVGIGLLAVFSIVAFAGSRAKRRRHE